MGSLGEVTVISMPLVFENLLAVLVFCPRDLRSRASRVFLLSALYLLVASLAFSLLYVVSARLFSKSIVPWLGLFLLMLSFARMMLSSPWLVALVVTTLGYCLNHFCSDIVNVVVLLIANRFEPVQISVMSPAVRLAVMAPVYAAFCLTLGRRFDVDAVKVHKRARWVLCCSGSLTLAIIFQQVFIDGQSGGARLALFLYDALCTALVMFTMIDISHQDRLESTLATIQELWNQKKTQYELTKKNIELINIKCHDIRKRISEAGERIDSLSPETVREISDSVRVYDSSVRTGNTALDTVLTDKRLWCSEDGIELLCMVDGSLLEGVSDDDLYFLADNILSNAIEAVHGLANAERRIISFTVSEAGPMVRILEENYFDGELEFVDGLPGSTKGDNDNHGFGMRSIRHTVAKYGGDLAVSAKDGVFSLSILLPRA